MTVVDVPEFSDAALEMRLRETENTSGLIVAVVVLADGTAVEPVFKVNVLISALLEANLQLAAPVASESPQSISEARADPELSA